MENRVIKLRNIFILAIFSLLPYPAALTDDAAAKLSANRSWSENFDHAQRSGIPAKWSKEGAKLGVPMTVCKVKDSVVQVLCSKSTGGIAIAPKVDLKKTPVMRWRWRVKQYPPEADGRNPAKDDQPVAIYIGINNGMLKKQSIAYRWETLTPIGFEGGTTYAKILSVHYIVMRNVSSGTGEWITEKRNILKDFQRVYGKTPDKFAISINGNSQYTKSNTVAEIDFIEFIPEGE